MNLQKTEVSLAKYHVLHLTVGFVFALVFLLIPAQFGIVLAVVALAVILPQTILPEFVDKKWIGTIAVGAGALLAWAIVRLIFHHAR